MDIDNKFKILDSSLMEHISNKLAKPDKTIKEHTIELLEVLNLLLELGYIEKGKMYDLVEKACIYHDLGKINKEFQKRVKSKNKKIKFDKNKEVVHNILSLHFIDEKSFKCSEECLKVSHGVLNHHDYCDVFEEMREKKELIKSLLEEFETQKVKKSTKSKLAGMANDLESIKIKGYLHKCDYSASSGHIAEYPNNFLENSLENLIIKWKKNNQNASWNDLQKFCIENKNENMIAVAQTGMGKTEAGLLWIGNNKGFFILPIRTAINAIYDRIRTNILEKENIDTRLAILHSSSLEYYMKNLTDDTDEKEEIDIINYQKIGKQLSMPLNISTMDQLFDFVYKYQGYELKLTTLSYSKVVIDEIQMYGPDLLAYLIYGLEKVVEHGGKIAILTATLPSFVKDLLEKNISFKCSPNGFTNDMIRHNLKILDKRINADDIYKKYMDNENLNRSNKILVVCNTIKEAQNLYEELKDLLKDESDKVNILHSKFIRMHRLDKEQEIIKFGETYNKNCDIDYQSGIWISTSIVEASLDIDFDYLFTELQDLNSLFQRLGRCNRKGKKDSSYENCFIYTEINTENFIEGEKGFIDKQIFDLSKEAICSCSGPISEENKIKLINTYLTTEKLKGSDYMRKYKEIYEFIKNIPPYSFEIDQIDLRNILSEDIIPSPIYEKYLEEIRDLEMKLQNPTLNQYDRLNLKEEIKKFTVSIHPNDIHNYNRARSKGNAQSYSSVKLSNYEYIKVIECNYDDSGYKRMKYDKTIRTANLL